MSQIAYKKLVRDNIPDIIRAQGKTPIVRTLSDEEYMICLKEKLIEEVNEFIADSNIEEFGDILEVMDAIKKYMNFTDADVTDAKNVKGIKNGSFDKKIFLEVVKC